MQEYIHYYLNDLKKRNASENTVESYHRDLQRFLRYLSSIHVDNLSAVNQTNITGFILDMQSHDISNATISRCIASLRGFFRFLQNENYLSKNPMYNIRTPKPDKKPPQILSISDIDTLLNQPELNNCKGIRDKAMLELLYATGLRVTELIHLQLAQINLPLKYILCCSREKQRIIPIGLKALDAMHMYLTHSRPHIVKDDNEKTLFLNRNGGPMSRQGFWKIIKYYSKKSNIQERITPHILRHSFAAHLIANGADPQSVQEMMGHSDIATTLIYVNLDKNKLADIYAKTHPRY